MRCLVQALGIPSLGYVPKMTVRHRIVLPCGVCFMLSRRHRMSSFSGGGLVRLFFFLLFFFLHFTSMSLLGARWRVKPRGQGISYLTNPTYPFMSLISFVFLRVTAGHLVLTWQLALWAHRVEEVGVLEEQLEGLSSVCGRKDPQNVQTVV
ncbi:hypothetical protein K470DRAFT_286268 [Piedraia hortae CBS 480.64]|uniref:Uncharacterized protein n=1 Tax=Piedraia hortae CBS 480.64 TaxID=1314780 RepID=A0A6A7C1Q4_9PEZI|nr:hypothetical protein K470DRAFT_286268 [Piedraia hortae CBS 480.64]